MRFESIRGQKRIRQVGVSSEKSNSTEASFFALTTKLNRRDETKSFLELLNFQRSVELGTQGIIFY